MPYHLEKGPLFATIEALYRDGAQLRTFLDDLWKGKALGQHGVVDSPSANGPNPSDPTGPRRLDTMLRRWFGEPVGGGTQPPWGPDPNTGQLVLTTGYWSVYYGDVRRIVGEALMRAAELSLGVARPADPLTAPPPQGDRHWPVEFFWKCGQPRFEGWVTWRDRAVGETGQVTVVFATPATPDTVFLRPGDGADPVGGQIGQGFQGMWVCTHANHEQWVMLTSLPTALGAWIVPTRAVMFTRGVGDVGTWAPRFGMGGPPSAPMQFVKAPPRPPDE